MVTSRSALSLIVETTARSRPRIEVSFIAPDPRHAGGRQIVFHTGDDADANEEFAQFVEALRFAPVLVGGLRDGGRLTQLDPRCPGSPLCDRTDHRQY